MKQLSLSMDYSFLTHRQKRKGTQKPKFNIDFMQSNQHISSPSIKNTSNNKRLKYYSTRNKDSMNLIDEQNMSNFQQQFKKFEDLNLKNTIKLDRTFQSKKDAFNLIVKKYCRNYNRKKFNKINHLAIRAAKSSQGEKQIQIDQELKHIQGVHNTQKGQISKLQRQKIIAFNTQNVSKKDIQATQKGQDQNFTIYQSKSNQVSTQKIAKISHITEKCTLSLKQCKSCLKPQRPSEQVKFKLRSSTKYSQPSSKPFHCVSKQICNNSSQNKLSIKQEYAIKAHFNKTSLSHYKNKVLSPKRQKLKFKVFLEKFQTIQPQNNQNAVQSAYSGNEQPQTYRSPKTSKGYVRTRGNSATIECPINPYTNDEYLQIRKRAYNQRLKTIQKLIQTSYSSSMTKSFQVKSISPQKKLKHQIKGQNGKNFKLDQKMTDINEISNDYRLKSQSYQRKYKSVQKEEPLINGWVNSDFYQYCNGQQQQIYLR